MIIGIDASRAFSRERTGTENYSFEMIKSILELEEAKKHKFRLYFRDFLPSKKEAEWLYQKNVSLVEINLPRLWTQVGLAGECLVRTPDLLWVPAHTLPILRRKKMKTVVTIHGLEYEYLPEYYKFPQKLWLNKSTEYAVKQADRLIAVSNWTKSQLVKRLSANPDKIKVIYEGVSSQFFAQGPASLTQERTLRSFSGEYMRQIRHKYSLEKKYILFVGTIQPRKNLVRLIEAFSLLKSLKTDLAIAGKKGWMTEEIMQAAEKYGVKDRVKFVGRVADADLPAVYKGASLFVWPSLMEGFGLPVLEAMMMGTPVVTSNRGALPEVVGEAGLQVNPESVEEIAQAMELVLGNQELRDGLIEKGYGQVKKFSYSTAAKKVLDYFLSYSLRL